MRQGYSCSSKKREEMNYIEQLKKQLAKEGISFSFAVIAALRATYPLKEQKDGSSN